MTIYWKTTRNLISLSSPLHYLIEYLMGTFNKQRYLLLTMMVTYVIIIIICYLFCLLDIIINFSQAMYVAMEANDTVQPELVFSNPSSFDITVQVIAIDITAVGVNDTVCDALSPDNDYTMGLYNVTFPANVTTRLLDILLCDDDVFESNESFSISVLSNSLPDNVMDGNLNQATIVIVDDDCKFFISYRYN